MATSVLRFTCPHEALACYSMSISQLVVPNPSERVSLKVCPSCAASIAGQVLEQLENTCRLISTDKLASASSDSQTYLHDIA